MTQGRLVRFLRFRTRDRDVDHDERRFAPLRAAIQTGLSSLELERTGLARRVEELRDWIAGLMGNGSDEEDQRDAADERTLADAERMLLAGDDRLGRIDEMRDLFLTMDRLLRDAEAAGRAEAVRNLQTPAASV